MRGTGGLPGASFRVINLEYRGSVTCQADRFRMDSKTPVSRVGEWAMQRVRTAAWRWASRPLHAVGVLDRIAGVIKPRISIYVNVVGWNRRFRREFRRAPTENHICKTPDIGLNRAHIY